MTIFAHATTAEEVRAIAIAHHTPRLDAFRARVPTMPTSDLLAYLTNTETLSATFPVDASLSNKTFHSDAAAAQDEMAAAVVAVGVEIDRRIPVPA